MESKDLESVKASHLITLMSYTIFSVILIGESILLKWEMWALPLIMIGIIFAWTIHIAELLPTDLRIWTYSILMMVTFFFYGIHFTSMYDIAPVMISVILIFSMTGNGGLVNLCVGTYIITMLYDVVILLRSDTVIDSLVVTRTLLHFVLVFIAGYVSKIIIRRNLHEIEKNNEKISYLEDVNRRTEDFLTNVSHELRTPINAVTGLSEMMLKKPEGKPLVSDISAIRKAGIRLMEQVGDILDYTEIDTGRIKVLEENYILASVINDLAVEQRMAIADKEVELVFDVDPKIPNTLYGDAAKIKKVFRHLISNAVKFTDKGGVYVRVYAIPKSYGINLCITVKDSGRGINPAVLERITEGFYQYDGGRTRKSGGLGLGLAIVYGLTAAMEGFMQVKSEIGQGTEVVLSIPQKVVDDACGMSITSKEKLCVGCFIKPDESDFYIVREFYDTAINHMVKGLGVPLYRAGTGSELERIITKYKLTHLFVGMDEYKDAQEFYNVLSK
nr:HAMP domain-containing histidine kinase [Lachnospiraceae bacterium]